MKIQNVFLALLVTIPLFASAATQYTPPRTALRAQVADILPSPYSSSEEYRMMMGGGGRS